MKNYNGSKIVDVYFVKNTQPEIGGMMLGVGNALGTMPHSSGQFFFDEITKMNDRGVSVVRTLQNRVDNVKSSGKYRKSQLKCW